MTGIFDKLAAVASAYRDPVREIPWDRADDDLPWLPAGMISFAGHPVWQTFSDDKKRQASRVEFARLCAAGLWLEGLLIHRVTHRGFVAAETDATRVVLQEVREEAGHGLMFLEMIDRAAMGGQSLLGATVLLTRVAKLLDPNGAPFWAMVYIGESVTDTFALRALKMSDDAGEQICPTARAVMELHHREEARHMAAAKAMIDIKLESMSPLKRSAVRALSKLLIRRFLDATLYPTEASLRALGIADAKEVCRWVRNDPARRQLADACAAPAMRLVERRMASGDVARVQAS